jgi:hypothetical protein
VLFIGSLLKWVSFKTRVTLVELFDSDETTNAKNFFNMWNYNVKDKNNETDLKIMIRNQLSIGLRENIIKEQIKKRTQQEKCNLITRRSFSIFLSVIILLIDASIIAGAYILTGYLQSLDTNKFSTSALDFIISLIPAIVISIMNGLIPLIMEMLVKFEKWDYNSTYLNQLMWRNYIAKLFTLMIVYFLVVYFVIFRSNTTDLIPGLNLDFNMDLSCPGNYTNKTNDTISDGAQLVSFTSYSNCDEDVAVVILIINLLSEFSSRKIMWLRLGPVNLPT